MDNCWTGYDNVYMQQNKHYLDLTDKPEFTTLGGTRMKKSWKQWMAITCALAMIVSLLPVTILAEEGVATPTDLAPIMEPVQETEPAEVSVEEPAEEPAEEEKVTYTARIAVVKRDGKILLTAVVEPEYTGAVIWEMKTQEADVVKWTVVESSSSSLMILPGSHLIGKEIRFRLADGTTSVLSYVVPEPEPVEAPVEVSEEGTDEPVVEINQEEPVEENEKEPAADEAVEEPVVEEAAEEPTEEPAVEEPAAEEEQNIEDYETPLGLGDDVESEPEVQEEPVDETEEEETIVEPSEEETIAELTEEETVVEVIEESPAEVTEEIPAEEEAADDELEIEIREETPVRKEAPAAVNTEEAPEEAEAETEEIIDGLDIREEPDGMSVILTTVSKDSEIEILEQTEDWVLVMAEGEQGYVFAADIAELLQNDTQQVEESAEETNQADVNTENMKVTIFTSRRKIMKLGETVYLTSILEGFEECSEIYYQWECDKGEGFRPVEGANEDTYAFSATAESLNWGWRLLVTFR